MNKETFFSSGGLIAAILTTSCCALPFLLFSLGVSGAWIGKLRMLEPYANYFMAAALVFVVSGFYVSRRKKQQAKASCETGDYCVSETADRVRAGLLWVSLGLIAIAVFWPKIVELLLGSSN